MTKEDKQQLGQEAESVLDFKDAKEMTIGQANRKAEEIEAGVKETDNVLDKYIKQHRDEIEAHKFDTIVMKKEMLADAEATATVEATEAIPNEDPVEEVAPSEATQKEVASTRIPDPIPGELPAKIKFGPEPTEPYVDDDIEIPEEPKKSRVKPILLSVLALTAVATASWLSYQWIRNQSKGETTVVSSSSSSKKKSSSSSSSTSANTEALLKDFNDQYAAFFTDDTQTKLKNDSFGNLEKLKASLEKLKDTKEYDAAKSKYDELVKQVSAIQTVNSQFTSPVIKDGAIDSKAQVKSDAVFSDVSTSNTQLNQLLKDAASQGRSQQVATPAPVPATEGNTTGGVNPGYSGFGLQSTGVPLQRNLSRVPYNQAALDDINNPAWTFNPGILEKILKIARERGHIVGDQYILERVNIINGNGYYNLFKPDGTYLFSINAKTGYFVGNGKGHSDALDY
ncbi:cell division site-positioning protein MapZ family protein [Streptococcus ilei]|uniref:cell division site-positioning protein MapZ family protein n=1 Tax=Streptococcus ilei TaxID=1156431 RepID=UPI0003B933A3|nr:cell division site-positioning protein MapZ family protein [Streptococcus ilei]AGY40979.1 hypothetical protein N596_09625 [Streptococcus ilei]